MSPYSVLADLVVAFHAAYALFVVLGLPAILLGAALGWRWVRNYWFRVVHLAMIAVVALESLVGIPCPLTVLEAWLRRMANETVDEGTFIGRCVGRLLFYQAPEWVFTVVYVLFAAAVAATLIAAPPRRRGTKSE